MKINFETGKFYYCYINNSSKSAFKIINGCDCQGAIIKFLNINFDFIKMSIFKVEKLIYTGYIFNDIDSNANYVTVTEIDKALYYKYIRIFNKLRNGKS